MQLLLARFNCSNRMLSSEITSGLITSLVQMNKVENNAVVYTPCSIHADGLHNTNFTVPEGMICSDVLPLPGMPYTYCGFSYLSLSHVCITSSYLMCTATHAIVASMSYPPLIWISNQRLHRRTACVCLLDPCQTIVEILMTWCPRY